MTEEREAEAHMRQLERLATVGQLAAGIAHHFNNILSVIIGNTQLLQERADLPAAVQKKLDIITQQSFWAADLVRQIMDFSRKSVTKRRVLNLGAMLEDLVSLLHTTIPSNIQIRLDIRADECFVAADPSQLQQIVTNLVVNARDAMPEGGELTMRVKRLTVKPGGRSPAPALTPGEWLVLAVIDTGTGIPAEHIPRLFDPFFTTKEVGKGTGLGLAQVFGLVQHHEGLVEVASKLGRGTTFTIYLPAVPAAQTAGQAAVQAIPAGRGELILVVEDEAVVRDVTRELLENLGYRVLAAANGLQALKLFEQQGAEIAAVLADVVMPRMGGLELFHALKHQLPGIRMLLITGYPLGVESERLQASGLAGWLTKPLDMARLAQALDEVLHRP